MPAPLLRLPSTPSPLFKTVATSRLNVFLFRRAPLSSPSHGPLRVIYHSSFERTVCLARGEGEERGDGEKRKIRRRAARYRRCEDERRCCDLY
ncbi:hypothetical protein BD626DRAFT_523839 [Schizophyllum amplum]|uniref:Uncharacterized protein n=1 Tax=Schizophyllum amplum TaxID=97359 RepID=A0A550BST8_9AGAR|nr:hypothetical protein BD626DRAFT_523839 [Auriculariopsis ampla]